MVFFLFFLQNSSLVERDCNQQGEVQNVHLLARPRQRRNTVSMLLQHISPPLDLYSLLKFETPYRSALVEVEAALGACFRLTFRR